MTEEEAKTKWCPFVRGVFGKNQNDSFDLKSNTVHNRVLLDTGDVGIHPAMNCIGSACMAWRWATINTRCEIQAVPDRPDWDPPFGPWEA